MVDRRRVEHPAVGDERSDIGDRPIRDVVVVCASGGRSKKATEMLTAAGIPASDLIGGMGAWASVYDSAIVELDVGPGSCSCGGGERGACRTWSAPERRPSSSIPHSCPTAMWTGCPTRLADHPCLRLPLARRPFERRPGRLPV